MMKQAIIRALASVLAISLIGGLSGCGGSGSTGEVLAVVGHQKITSLDYDQAINNLPENYKVLTESYKGKRRILENLVKKALLVQEAEARGYQKDETVKKNVKTYEEKALAKADAQLAVLKTKRQMIPRQVYENVLLNELNQKLKKEGVKGIEITPEEITKYYADYAKKVQILKPGAAVPKEEQVSARIKAILVEENLIKQLQKKNKIEIKEDKFRSMYGGKDGQDISIEDNGTGR